MIVYAALVKLLNTQQLLCKSFIHHNNGSIIFYLFSTIYGE